MPDEPHTLSFHNLSPTHQRILIEIFRTLKDLSLGLNPESLTFVCMTPCRHGYLIPGYQVHIKNGRYIMSLKDLYLKEGHTREELKDLILENRLENPYGLNVNLKELQNMNIHYC